MPTIVKILCFHKAEKRASYRYRVAQFLPHWTNYHINVEPICISGKQFFSIFKFLFILHKYDAVLLQRSILPKVLIKIITRRSKVIFDFDDALYTRESHDINHKKELSKHTIKKLNYTLKKSTLIFAGSNDLVDYAKQYNSSVHLIPTAYGKQIAAPVRPILFGEIKIGWIGNNANLSYLPIIDEATHYLQLKYPAVTFSIMCDRPPEGLKTIWHLTEWSSAAENNWLQSIDIGIMPLSDDRWSRGKCAFKLIQYMAHGKPVVASNVGANKSTVSHTINGYLAGNSEEWISGLEQLILNRDVRINMGMESLNIFTEQFERSYIQLKMANILHTSLQELVAPH